MLSVSVNNILIVSCSVFGNSTVLCDPILCQFNQQFNVILYNVTSVTVISTIVCVNHCMVDCTFNNTNYHKTEKVFKDLVTLILYAYVFKVHQQYQLSIYFQHIQQVVSLERNDLAFCENAILPPSRLVFQVNWALNLSCFQP